MRNVSLIIVLFSVLNVFAQTKKPNILWIVCEDISPTLSMYGDDTAKTPNLDSLAEESMVFHNAFAPVGVCAPSRSAIITGMYPTSIGTMHMRTGKDIHSMGKRTYENNIETVDINKNPIRQYSAVIPEDVKCFTEYLRAQGYFCTNNQKTDYQFASPVTAWDQNNGKAHWRNRADEQPFFSVFNIGITHESRLWLLADKPLTVDPQNVSVPPYLPDNEITRKDIARHYSNVELMDAEVGKIIQQLKDDGLYDNTIIFFYSDHGGPLPRQKRAILDSGLKVPFFVKSIESKEIGSTNTLISFVDLAPTLLSLANVKPPKYMDGKAFLGSYKSNSRNYVYGSSDRFDESTDRIRSVRDQQFLYLKNFHTNLPRYKNIGYRKNIPMMNEMLSLKNEGKLTKEQEIWFQTKTSEELYDCKNDPFNLVNLAEKKEYKSILKKFRKEQKKREKKYEDFGEIPENELINNMWPNFKQPITKKVIVKVENNNLVKLTCSTKGASIGYIISKKTLLKVDINNSWKLYTKPIKVNKGEFLYTISQRIGFKESRIEVNKI